MENSGGTGVDTVGGGVPGERGRRLAEEALPALPSLPLPSLSHCTERLPSPSLALARRHRLTAMANRQAIMTGNQGGGGGGGRKILFVFCVMCVPRCLTQTCTLGTACVHGTLTMPEEKESLPCYLPAPAF